MFDFAAQAQYEAVRRRDPAVDGVVFVAVKTTGISIAGRFGGMPWSISHRQ
jgi:hypothetical protein